MCIACTSSSDVLFNGHQLLIDQQNAGFILGNAVNGTLKVFIDESLPDHAEDFASDMISDIDAITGTNILETHVRHEAQIVINEEPDTVRVYGHHKSGVNGLAWWNSEDSQYMASVIPTETLRLFTKEYDHVVLHEFMHTLGVSHHEDVYDASRTLTAMGNRGWQEHSGQITDLDVATLQAIHGTKAYDALPDLVMQPEPARREPEDLLFWNPNPSDFDWQTDQIYGPLAA